MLATSVCVINSAHVLSASLLSPLAPDIFIESRLVFPSPEGVTGRCILGYDSDGEYFSRDSDGGPVNRDRIANRCFADAAFD